MLNLQSSLLTVGLAIAFALPLYPAVAQVDDAIQVTNPDELESMGFARDADNVYMDNATSAAVASSAETDAEAAVTPTVGTDYSAISAKEFIGRVDTSGTQWRYSAGATSFELSRVGSEAFADAQFWLPTNATLRVFRFWAFDNNIRDLGFLLFEVCHPPFGAGPSVVRILANIDTIGRPGLTSRGVALNRRVDNRSCVYVARVRFEAPSPSLFVQKVRLQFTR